VNVNVNLKDVKGTKDVKGMKDVKGVNEVKKHTITNVFAAAGLCTILAAPAFAQSRPLVTEDPQTVPAGFVLLEGGLDFLKAASFPASGLKGDLLRVGSFGLSIGVSSVVELQVDGGLRRRLSIDSFDATAPLAGLYTGTGPSTSGFDDLFFGAKIRFVTETETRPAVALRFTTRLPFAGPGDGLGTGTSDFHIGLAAAKTMQSLRVAANLGLAILGDPTDATSQNHLLNYGLSFARAVATGTELVAELNGRLDTGGNPAPSTESRGALRLGGRFTRGPVRLDGAMVIGLTDTDPSFGFSTGFTWVFKAFEVK
jgi:hypothetical protein